MMKMIKRLILLLAMYPFASSAQLTRSFEKGLILDLDADHGVYVSDSDKVESWANKVPDALMKTFDRRDEGRKVPGSGRPSLKRDISELRGHHSLVFVKHELLNKHEDACDHLIQGSGFTWVAVVRPYQQIGLLKDVNAIFGNLKNGPNNEGFWAGFTDDNRLWSGPRNGITFGRWDENNPFLATKESLDTSRYYLLAGRLGAGTDTVQMQIFVNDLSEPSVSGPFPVNPKADASMLSIGQERDAIEHPGVESFIGELARLMIFERPLSDREMRTLETKMKKYYGL